jgi:hypothetical protein
VPPTDAPFAPAPVPPQVAGYEGEHWIDVDLSQQRVYAYAGNTVEIRLSFQPAHGKHQPSLENLKCGSSYASQICLAPDIICLMFLISFGAVDLLFGIM